MIKPKNLLIVRTDRIGDVVLTLPLAEIVKKHFPDCRITFLVRDYTKCLVHGHPFIDEVLILKELNGKPMLAENIKNLSSRKFDSCVIVYPTFTLALIIYLSRIKQRIGTGYRWYSFLFNNKVFQHRKFAEMHEVEFNVNLLRCFGINERISKDTVNFNLSAGYKPELEKLLKENKIDGTKPVIIIHPGSGGSAVDLPAAKFKELVQQLSTKNDLQIVITGSKQERKLCKELQVTETVKNFAGQFNLAELTYIISKADIFISNSTGPIHIAAALGKNTIGFYPHLLACSAKRWEPYSNKSVIFTPENNCQDCAREQCRKQDCMNRINMQKVFSVIEQKIKNFSGSFSE